ncbi:secretory carrier-associated membrane protein [Anaeramoeba flamelloides]|uniref:Secretory carrier-associated membrane protein n=1 Tax=Anaeramoeba flamelloides TaxID=1746091 RepID=A0AAV7Z7B0_9EUKA|nr:secretory carrier-associated membrane protein [Anaeramoeba flamelloides]
MINPFDDSSSTSEDDESVTQVFENINDQSLTVEQKENENTLNNNRAEGTKDEGYKPPEYLNEGNDLEQKKTFEERELSLEQREQELIRREQELEKKSKKSGIDLNRPPNWPKCRPMLYHDISKDIPRNCRPFVRFIMFFSTYSMWFLFSVFITIGVKGTGAAGLINTIDIFGLNKIVGIFMVTNVLVWVIEILFIVVILKEVNNYYKSSSMTTEQAKQEFGTEVGKTLASGMI